MLNINPNLRKKNPLAVCYLAGPLLDHDVRILTDGTSLLGEGLGRSGVSLGLEVVLIIRHSGKAVETQEEEKNNEKRQRPQAIGAQKTRGERAVVDVVAAQGCLNLRDGAERAQVTPSFSLRIAEEGKTL